MRKSQEKSMFKRLEQVVIHIEKERLKKIIIPKHEKVNIDLLLDFLISVNQETNTERYKPPWKIFSFCENAFYFFPGDLSQELKDHTNDRIVQMHNDGKSTWFIFVIFIYQLIMFGINLPIYWWDEARINHKKSTANRDKN